MRKKITTLQTEKLQLLNDVETGEKMLELQTKINAELQDQLNEMKIERSSGQDVLRSQLRETQDQLEEKQSRLAVVEKQLKDVLYTTGHRHKLIKSTAHEMEDEGEEEKENDENYALQLLSQEKDLVAGDNVLEIWIKTAKLDAGLLPRDVSTFAMIDFFDFETQTTGLHTGLRPQYNFATTFRVKMDDFLMKHMSTMDGAIRVEINKTVYRDFEMIAYVNFLSLCLSLALDTLHLNFTSL